MHSHTSPAVPAAVTPLVRYLFALPSDHVALSMPRDHYDTAIETLTLDAQTSGFDRSLREQISEAIDSITTHAPVTAAAAAPETSDPIPALIDIAFEGDLWEHTASLAELRQAVRNMRNTAKAALTAAGVTPKCVRTNPAHS